MSDYKFAEEQICKVCGEVMLMMYGNGWDYDRLVCGSRSCDNEVEFDSTSYYEDEKKEVEDGNNLQR